MNFGRSRHKKLYTTYDPADLAQYDLTEEEAEGIRQGMLEMDRGETVDGDESFQRILDELARSAESEDLALAEQGLEDWAAALDEEDRERSPSWAIARGGGFSDRRRGGPCLPDGCDPAGIRRCRMRCGPDPS